MRWHGERAAPPQVRDRYPDLAKHTPDALGSEDAGRRTPPPAPSACSWWPGSSRARRPSAAAASSERRASGRLVRRRGRHRRRAGAEAGAADPHRGDRLVLLAGPGRPRRGRPAGDRRAVLLDVRVRRRRSASWAGAGRARAGSTRRRWSPISRATASRTSWSGGNEGTVAAYEFRGGRLQRKAGWPASTNSGGQSPEVRGLAAADLDGDGRVEVVATTTNTATKGAQVFVFDAGGRLFRPGGNAHAWPRNRGYGAYGENVGIGNIDDDPQLEILATFDNHQINAFNLDGTSILASPWFTNRESGKRGEADGLGRLHPVGQPEGRAAPLPPAQGRVAEPGPPALAAVDRLAALGRGPGRRRPQRGDRAPERREAHPLPHPGLRVHGAGRCVRRRQPLGDATPGLRQAGDLQPAGPPTQRRLVPAFRDPRSDGRRPHRRRASRDRGLAPRRQGLRRGTGRPQALDRYLRAQACEGVRLGGGRGRPQQGRQSRSWSSAPTRCTGTPDAWSCSRPRARSSRRPG